MNQGFDGLRRASCTNPADWFAPGKEEIEPAYKENKAKDDGGDDHAGVLQLKGLDFVRTLKNPPSIIITSAYHEYALEGYELNVVDYLLKPIEFSRFLMAVNKLRQAPAVNSNRQIATVNERAFMFFNVSKKRIKVYLDEVLYIESLKEYIRIFTKEKSILTKFQLGEIEELLSRGDFLRVHRSFIVARNKIDAYSATDIEIQGKQIPIGRSYKELVQSILENHST